MSQALINCAGCGIAHTHKSRWQHESCLKIEQLPKNEALESAQKLGNESICDSSDAQIIGNTVALWHEWRRNNLPK